jgi:hypothetical protein
MDKLIGALTKDDDHPSPSSLPSGNKATGGALGPLAGNLLGLLDNDDDVKHTANDASHRAGDSGTSELFKSILQSIGSEKEKVVKEDIDEDHAVTKHKKYFVDDDDDDDQADSRGLGAAAAMQALKAFTSGQTPTSTSSATKTESLFLATAMAEASKLFDQKASQGKVAPEASKESAVQQAGELALKMYVKSQLHGGGASSGASGSGDLLGLASKFLK